MPITLYIKDADKPIGTLTEEQLQTLIDLLEEEDDEDRDYYIDRDILEYMAEEGADAALLDLLRPHVNGDDGIEIEWREEA